ncbi:MAG: hypothetical protein ABJ360_12150, partial [Roseobacter sp.]
MQFEITLDASKGYIKAIGDREFVLEAIDKYRKIVEEGVNISEGGVSTPLPDPLTPAKEGPSGGGGLDDFSNVFDIADDTISILATIPGKTQSAQAKNMALLYLFAKLKLGQEIVANDDIREQCKAHAIYDSTNYAAHMKGQKKLVTVLGSKG